MQQDTTAVISDGEELGEDYDLDYGFEDLEDSSSDDDCCMVSVSDAGVGECHCPGMISGLGSTLYL
jgi:hypothetical protein